MKIRLFFILCALIIGGCRANAPESANGSAKDGNEITVSAAVSLKDAFNEISRLYKSKIGKTVNFNFGASGALQKQIETGAPVDIFASAGTSQMDDLAKKGLIMTETRRNFARNTLVLIVPENSKLNIKDFSDLSHPEVQKIAAGNPKTVPAGQYTEQVLSKSNLSSALQPKMIFAEDVRQVLDYVVRGEVDAGIVYASDAQSSGDKVRVVTTASEDSHEPILYPIAIVQDTKQNEAAQDFINLVLGAEGQAILKKYGFSAIPDK